MDSDLAFKSFENNEDEQWFQVMLKCSEFPSINSAHGYRLRGETDARIFDQPWVVKFRGEIRDQLILLDPKKKCKWLNPNDIYYLYIKFILKSYFWNRDYDNCIKIFQDEIFNALHINDSHIVEGHQYKSFRPGDYEYAIIRVGISNYNYKEFS